MLILHRKISSLPVSSSAYQEPNLSLTIAISETSSPSNDEAYVLGETIEYSIAITNTGNVTASNIVLMSEVYGYEIEDITHSIDNDKTELSPGETATASFSHEVTEQDILAGSVDLTISASGHDPDDSEVSASEEIPSPIEPIDTTLTCNIKIVNEPANNEAYVLGERINYEIDVTNDGNVTYNNVQVLCEEGGISETIYSLHIGETETLETSHIVDESDIINGSFTATVTAEGDELADEIVPPMGDDSVTTGDEDDPDGPNYPIEEPNPSFAVSIGYINPPANGTSYAVDENVQYELNVTNDGNLAMTNVEVADETSGDSYTDISFDVDQLRQFGYHSHRITLIDIDDGYFIIAGFVAGTSSDENNPEYAETFNIQIPITPE